jgi:ArsR family transcriptional regulator
MAPLAGFLKVMADETRLRMVRLLAEGSLNVGELVRILGLAQSTVSRQLGELRKAGLVHEQREAGFAYYELVAPNGSATYAAVLEELRAAPDQSGDLARLSELRRERSELQDRDGRFLEPGRSWAAWSRALSALLPPLRVADFGCGDGALSAEMALWAREVAAIDRNAAALRKARERCERRGLSNVSFLEEDLERRGSLRTGSRDLVVVSRALHYAHEPAAILREARRVLARGGRVIVLELAPHAEEWVREKLNHVALGFTPEALAALLAGSGFERIVVERAPGKAAREPFRILIARGVAA